MISNTYKVKISGPLWREETVNINRHREDSGGEIYAYISNAKGKKKVNWWIISSEIRIIKKEPRS